MALFSAFQVQAEGEKYVFGVDETVVLGDLSNFASITATGSNITTGNIYSPDAYIGFLSPFKEEWQIANDLVGASWDELVAVAVQDKLENSIDLSYLTVNGNVEGRFIDMDAVATINGNVVAHGEITEEEFLNGLSWNDSGVFMPGAAYNLGGVKVTGDVKASVVQVIGFQPNEDTLNHVKDGTACGGLIVYGDITTDYLLVDTSLVGGERPNTYDKYSDYLEAHGDVTVNKDAYTGGKILVKGKLTVNGTFYNAFGEYIEIPELTSPEEDYIYGLQPPEVISTEANELDAKNIVNASNLFVGTLTNDRSQTYTQTYGTIRVKDNWFRDSVINMSGGYINEDSLGPDKNLGINNVFNVTGGTLIVGDLNFDSTVNLSQDGHIQTDIESIFINPDGDPEALNYVGLNASEPESVKQSLSRWFTNYVPGTLRTDLEDHVNFNGGSIVVSGFGTITETQYDDLMKAFKEAFQLASLAFSLDKYQFQKGHFSFIKLIH